MINATKSAPSSGGNAGGCAFACHESDPTADNLGNPNNEDNYALAQNLGVVTRIQRWPCYAVTDDDSDRD